MEIKLFGAAKEVTGSCYSLETKNEKILIDCGMFQGGKDNERKNYEDFAFNPREYNALLLTHAHLDHCGRLPKLVKNGFKGNIYATDATKELAFVILMDSAKIAAQDIEHENKRRAQDKLPPRQPIYVEADIKDTMKLFKKIEYDEETKITENITAKFYDAGHILGAASIQVKIKEGKKNKIVAFSGDLGQAHSVLVREIEPIKKADDVFIESTYGDRLHNPIGERQKELIRIINETYNRGGKLMIPSFAVERAQEMLFYIGEFMSLGLVPKMKVFLDSPMATRATEVFRKFPKYYNDDVRESLKKRKDPFSFPELIITESVVDSKKINFIKEPCIIIAGNGMCSAGRIKHHIRNNIGNPKNTLLFIGYQANGTLGYWIKGGERKIRLLGDEAQVNAKIESIEGFSAHADYKGLISWLDNYNPKPDKVFIVHGEEEQAQAFEKRIKALGYTTYIPTFEEDLTI